jgi:hypothetical protein
VIPETNYWYLCFFKCSKFVLFFSKGAGETRFFSKAQKAHLNKSKTVIYSNSHLKVPTLYNKEMYIITIKVKGNIGQNGHSKKGVAKHPDGKKCRRF